MISKLVSIIIPLYNAEKYIQDTIRSVAKQSYKNIEVIIVDDGSTDRSTEIAEQELNYQQIMYVIIHQNNKGVSAARNTGINAANGEWVIALDADDCLDNDAIQVLVDCSNKADVAFLKYRIVSKYEDDCRLKYLPQTAFVSGEEAIRGFYKRENKLIAPGAFVSKKYLQINKINYDVDCHFAEDDLYVWKLLAFANRVAIVNTPLYQYVFHSNSTMTSSRWEKFLSTAEAAKRCEKILLASHNADRISDSFLLRHYFGTLHAAALVLGLKDYMKLFKGLKYREVYRGRKKAPYNRGNRLLTFSMYISPCICYYLFRLLNCFLRREKG